MGVVQEVQDGKFVESASQSSLSNQKAKNSGMDKDAFLQLLVAQMKYQDPLEPTSNTEFIAQYAQFSQVEQISNMASSMTLQRASGMVGQEVIIETTNSSGKTMTVQGRVDYVTYENNKAFLSVNGGLYSIDDVTNVIDAQYQAAYDKAVEYVGRVNKLPRLDLLSVSDEEKLTGLNKEYEEMTDYEKRFVAKDVLDKLKAYNEKMVELKAEKRTEEANEGKEPEDQEESEEP